MEAQVNYSEILDRVGPLREEVDQLEEQALQTKMSQTALGGLSFFAWFGYVGPRVTAEESKAATAKRDEHRKLRREGKEDSDSETSD